MRKRHNPANGMANNAHRKPHFQRQGGGGGYQQRGGGAPRKNFAALREKYINQAKEAMASGDRVLAEYYYQHADHYYRMQQEFMESRARWREQQPEQGGASNAEFDDEGENNAPGSDEPDIDIPNNSNVLPAFLTRKVEVKNPQNLGEEDKVVALQEWEE